MRISTSFALSLFVFVASACQHGDTPTGLAETEALLETAPSLSFDSALDELGLPVDERARLGGLASQLHTAMLDAHDTMGQVQGADHGEREAAHDRMRAQLEDVHARHKVFMDSMTPDQQAAFATAVHRQMAEAHGDLGDHEGMEGDHEGMGHDSHGEAASDGRHHVGGHAAH